VGVAYRLQATSTGQIGTPQWFVGSGALPPGLALGPTSGVIAGVPTFYGTFAAEIRARDSWDASRVAGATVVIAVAPAQIAVATSSLPGGTVGGSYQAALTATGGSGSTAWSIAGGSLPDGLTLSSSGLIAGRPITAGTFTFAVRASDTGGAGNVASRTLGIAVSASEIVPYASNVTTVAGTWSLVADTTAAGGYRLWNPDLAAPKITTPLASPPSYFELTFQAEARVPYHLWIRARADRNYWGNDSVFAQFSDSTDANGTPVFRIGSASGSDLNLEDCSSCGLAGWGWQDNGWGVNVFGPNIYFEKSGPQTIRIQIREDGLSIDQIVLSAAKYLVTAPGALKNDTTILGK